MRQDQSAQRVAIVGGGLAGLAAAVALSDSKCQVQLFESRKQLGGRAGSYCDPTTGEIVDHCQHVSMRCCTNFADFCHRTETSQFFRRFSLLHFFSPTGRRYRFRASRLLPAPFHLAPSLMRLGYLSLAERIGVSRALLKLARTSDAEVLQHESIGQWLQANRQSERAISRFWNVVLVSALGESLDKASCAAARKVFLDGFILNRHAYEVEVPTIALAELYDRHVAGWLRERAVRVHLEQPVASLEFVDNRATGLRLSDGSQHAFDYVIAAVPWRQLPQLITNETARAAVDVDKFAGMESSPITAVHLWFDRPITKLPHAVIVDRLSQWLFNHGQRSLPGKLGDACFAYQVVISASHNLAGRVKQAIRDQVLADLAAIWPATADARLLGWQLITQRNAVFSYGPGLDAIRPDPATPIANLLLAGDWTATAWPATMESAIRSGYRAAECLLDATGEPRRILVDDLPPGRLARWLIRSR